MLARTPTRQTYQSELHVAWPIFPTPTCIMYRFTCVRQWVLCIVSQTATGPEHRPSGRRRAWNVRAWHGIKRPPDPLHLNVVNLSLSHAQDLMNTACENWLSIACLKSTHRNTANDLPSATGLIPKKNNTKATPCTKGTDKYTMCVRAVLLYIVVPSYKVGLNIALTYTFVYVQVYYACV